MNDIKKPSVKSKVEAILFSTGHRISLDEISKLSRSLKDDVLNALKELQKEYDEKQSSLMLADEGEFWKFAVRDHFIPMVRKIVTETELTKTVLETLSVVAFKYPILQSDLIKIRTNKAYDHLVELEKIKEEQRQKAEDLKKEDEKIKKEIDSLDEAEEEFEVPLKTYEAKSKELISKEFEKEGNLIVEKEKLGDMEIIGEEQKQKKEARISEQAQATEQPSQIIQQQKTEEQQTKKQKKKSEGIKLTPEMEKAVDKKVEEMLNPQQKPEEKKEN